MAGAALQILLFLFPWWIRRRLLSMLFGYGISGSARIGLSIVLAGQVSIGPFARIGHLTVIKGLRSLRIDEHASVGNLNWVTGLPLNNKRHFNCEADRNPSLSLGRHASVTHRHLIDCTNAVTIGDFSIVGGWGSQILTHAIDFKTNRQKSGTVHIGRYCFLGTRIVLLRDAALPDHSVLAAGSVLNRAMSEEGMLYGGVPAAAVRPLDAASAYFTRTSGFVD